MSAERTVLVVDDNLDLNEVLVGILTRQGYAAEGVHDIRSATDWIGRAKPDVAVIDLDLPDGSGLDLLAAMRSRSPGTACIMFTGNPSPEVKEAAARLGAVDFHTKGDRIDRLLGSITWAAKPGRRSPERPVTGRQAVAAFGSMAPAWSSPIES